MKRILRVAGSQLSDSRIPLAIFYSVIVLLAVLIYFTTQAQANMSVHLKSSGLGNASFIFIFIMGLNSFKSSYHFFQAFNISRKAFYWGNAMALTGLALVMSLIDIVISRVLSWFMVYQGTYETLYQSTNAALDFLWSFSLLLAAACAGWLITLLYYRSNKTLKLLISLSPVVIVLIVHQFDQLLNGDLVGMLLSFFTWLYGTAEQPWNSLLFFGFTAIALYAVSFLLVRKAPIKE